MARSFDDTERFHSGVPKVLAEVIKTALNRGRDPEDTAMELLTESLEYNNSRDGAWPLLGADALITSLSADAVEGDENPAERLGALYRRCLGGS